MLQIVEDGKGSKIVSLWHNLYDNRYVADQKVHNIYMNLNDDNYLWLRFYQIFFHVLFS